MNPRAWSIVIVSLTAGVAVAVQGSPHEQTLQQMIGSLDKIVGKLKTITDEPSADASKDDLRAAAKSFVEARTKAAKLPQPEKDEKRRLEKVYKPKLDEVLKKMNGEMRRVEAIPGGKEALKEIAPVLKKDGK